MPKFLTILIAATLLVSNLRGETEFVTRYSLSKQFVVYGPKGVPAKRGSQIPLDPALLAVSCERIKQTVLNELGEKERWSFRPQDKNEGKIYLVIHPDKRRSPVITPINSYPGMSYRIDLPNEIDSAHLIEAVTQATLLEMVNRDASGNFTQVPRWLAQGLTAKIQAAGTDTLVLQQNRPVVTTKVRVDPIAKIRKELTGFDPLTFEELSWPNSLSLEKTRNFETCAELFVHELLRMKNGDDCLRQFLTELPRHLNWQVAFLRAFDPHFKHLVDVEKWWGLRLVNLSGRDAAQLWSHEQSLDRIDALLRISVKIHSKNALPGRSEMTLQEVLSEWEPDQQKRAFAKLVNQLQSLRIRVQPECAILLDGYRAALASHINEADTGVFRRVFSRDDGSAQTRATQLKLDTLDQQRAALRKMARPSTREEAIHSALEIAGQRALSSKQ